LSRTSTILIAPRVPLQSLPDVDRDILRRFFTEHVRGMDAKHHKRWVRFVRDLFNAQPGEGFQLYRVEARGGPYHRMHRAVLERLLENQERYTNIDVLHDKLKLMCWFVEWVDGKPRPRSTSFADCSEDEIREFHTRMVDLLRAPHVTRHFWPHLQLAQRQEMVDLVLRNPKEDEPQ
jgi:hypothetical protein